ncbi:alpha/beta hydrolase [Brucella intermedia]|uniref:alpha/beta hydrolase n=1 Tax=Brucella intermedia TaxID=94625 RepID=UPI00124DAB41|nr:alpha/beta hydrolase [Brucella intermedia]
MSLRRSEISYLPQPFTVIVSRRDRALGISRRLTGGLAPIGSGSDIAFLQNKNIQVLEISEVDNGGHSLFASSNTMIQLAAVNCSRRWREAGSTC